MDFGDSSAESAFRGRLRAWLVDHNPGLPASSTDDEYWAGMAAWHRSLFDAGLMLTPVCALPLIWPARVPNQVLSEADYEIVIDDLASVTPWAPRGVKVRGRASVEDHDGALRIRIEAEVIWSWGINPDAEKRFASIERRAVGGS